MRMQIKQTFKGNNLDFIAIISLKLNYLTFT